MSKFTPHIHRKDSIADHAHSMPDGRWTNCALYKPTKDRFGWHTHLYQMDGRTHETSPAHDGADHIHNTELGDTSGPMPVPKDTSEVAPRTDSLRHEGMHWVIRNQSMAIVARGRSRAEAFSRYDSQDDDESAYKSQVADFSEGLWEKAKSASQQALGQIKWPFVTWWYQQQGGSLK